MQENKSQSNFLRTRQRIAAKLFYLRKIGLRSQLANLTIFSLVFVLIFAGAHIWASSMDSKSFVLGATSEALSHLKEAQSLVAQKDFEGSQHQFLLAQKNFSDARSNLASLGQFLNSAIALSNQGKMANTLLDAGEAITLAGLNLTDFYNYALQIKVSPAGFETPDGFYETVTAADNYLAKANGYLEQAHNDLVQIDPNSLPGTYRDKYATYKTTLESALGGMQEVQSLLSLFRDFVGPSQKTILVLFENNNELRPTGGFIGTYGVFKLQDGKITSQKISSIYDLDGQLKQKIAPPGQMHLLTDHWGIRDSNWFADFEVSAQKANSFYELEAGESVDAVVAVTPDLFIDLLQQTGPIDFPKYNVTLSADNFRSVIQFNTSVNYDKQLNMPKQMLADFAPLMLQRLSQISKDNPAQILGTVLSNLNKKNILFYDSNPDIESRLALYNWAGKIQTTDKDYLSIYSANLEGTKTDLQITQSADLMSETQPDGSIINTLSYTRVNQAQEKNNSYVRFLVPQGSQLITATGFDKEQYYHNDGSDFTADQKPAFTVDPDLAALETNLQFESGSGTAIASESGKTSFGNWINLAPGETRNVIIKYKLPFNFNAGQKYSIVMQKQPGATPLEISYSLVSTRKVIWYTPDDLTVNGDTVSKKFTLNADTFIGTVLAQ